MSVTAVPLQPVKRSYILWLWLGLLAGAAAAVALAWYGTRPMVAARMSDADFLAWHKQQPGIRTLPSGVQYEVIREGTGPKPKDGEVAFVRIAGRLRNGAIFQPDTQAATPFQLGPGQLIRGFDEAVREMPEGSRYRVWIPGDQGYGAEGEPRAGIPGDATLIFDIELRDVLTEAEQRAIQERQMRQQQMMQQLMQQQQQQMGGAGNETAPAPSEDEPALPPQ